MCGAWTLIMYLFHSINIVIEMTNELYVLKEITSTDIILLFDIISLPWFIDLVIFWLNEFPFLVYPLKFSLLTKVAKFS